MRGKSSYINQGATGLLLCDWNVTKQKVWSLSETSHVWQGIFFMKSDPTVIKNTSNPSSDIKKI